MITGNPKREEMAMYVLPFVNEQTTKHFAPQRRKRSRSRSRSRRRSASPRRRSRRSRSRSRSRTRSPRSRSRSRDRKASEPFSRSLGGPINADHEEAVEFAKISKRENRVYVGNLSYDVRYRDLMEFMRGGGFGRYYFLFGEACGKRWWWWVKAKR